MKVLYVSHTPELKGSAVSLYKLMTGLGDDGFSPVAAFAKDGPLVTRLRSEGVPAHVLKSRGFLGLGLVVEALGLIKKEGVGLVHLNCAVPFCKYVGIAARINRTPVVWHIREDPAGKWTRMLRPWIKRLPVSIMAVSTEIYDAFSSTGKAVRIYNGVDASEFSPEVDGLAFRSRWGIPGDAFLYGIVGSIQPRKGTELFIKAAAMVAEHHPEAMFLVAGSGLPEHESGLREQIKSLPALDGKVVLTGRISDTPECMAALDLLVMPSLWEGFPRALIEAMAAGKCVVATDVGEVRHIVEDGVTGFIIPKDDLGALTEAMERCISIRAGLDAIGKKARERVVSEFSISGHIGQVKNEYSKILAGR